MPSSSPRTLYTLSLTPDQADALANWCEAHAWSFYDVPYASYAYRGEDVNVVRYSSGKLVVQGKQTEWFILNVLEPEITQKPQFGLEKLEYPEWFRPHAGLDESGKGDLFGPLVAACVIADEAMVDFWLQNGLKESKAIASDARLFEMERLVRKPKGVVVETAFSGMEKYNELYAQFGNLNELLAWFHAKALENAWQRRSVTEGLLDQFTPSKCVQKVLKKDGFCENFVLRQCVRAESDPVVAAASVVARATYVRQLKHLSECASLDLPKGAGVRAKEMLQRLIEKQGRESLPKFAKMHFRTISGK
ncbi:MAG: ribonuclease HIII [Opitutales bacterium]|nr:ribonuclease HIII [Opitutales bacterium]